MAIYEEKFNGDFNDFVKYIDRAILTGSFSANFVDGSFSQYNGVSHSVRVYERYSVVSKNRLSLTVSVLGYDGELKVSLIAAGASQGLVFKFNTFSESNFIAETEKFIREYKSHL